MKTNKLFFVVSCALLMASGLFAQSPYRGDVLFVRGDQNPRDSDPLIARQLRYMGFTVTEVGGAASQTSDADGKKFVYVSATCNSGDVAAKFKNVSIPVLLTEGFAADDMGMIASTEIANGIQVSMEILDDTHYLAGGLAAGDTAMIVDTTGVGHDLPAHYALPSTGDAVIIAQYVGQNGAIFAYEKGDRLADGTTAAGRRYFLPWHDPGFQHASGRGIKLWTAAINWVMGFDVITGVKESPGTAPVGFALNQNYPNPFWSEATSRFAGNPSTTISFSIPVKAHVQLDVYNFLGQKVATLKNEKMAAGRHDVRFDANGLASGIYFYQLRTDSRTLTRKMILMR